MSVLNAVKNVVKKITSFYFLIFVFCVTLAAGIIMIFDATTETAGLILTALGGFGLGLFVTIKISNAKTKIVGKALILHELPEKKAEEVEFDATHAKFEYDKNTYNVNSDGTFYGFWSLMDRLKKILTALLIYRFGSADPITFNEPYPTITAEVLKTMAGESVTGTGMKSLRSAGKPIKLKWILIAVVGIIVAVVLVLFLPQIISGIWGLL